MRLPPYIGGRIRRMRYEAEIDQMTPDNWDTMLALAKTKDEAIKEKLIIIPDLTFDAAMATIENYRESKSIAGHGAHHSQESRGAGQQKLPSQPQQLSASDVE